MKSPPARNACFDLTQNPQMLKDKQLRARLKAELRRHSYPGPGPNPQSSTPRRLNSIRPKPIQSKSTGSKSKVPIHLIRAHRLQIQMSQTHKLQQESDQNPSKIQIQQGPHPSGPYPEGPTPPNGKCDCAR